MEDIKAILKSELRDNLELVKQLKNIVVLQDKSLQSIIDQDPQQSMQTLKKYKAKFN